MIKRLRFPGFIALVFISVAACQAAAPEPPRPGQESFITRALYVDERLWVLSDAGSLSSIAEGDDRWRRELLAEPVFDACVLAGDLVVATGKFQGTTEWVIRTWTSDAWSVRATVPRQDDDLLALDCTTDRVTLVTSRRLVDIDGDIQHATSLSGDLKRGFVHNVHGTPEAIFVGANAGEWGGGLDRIDRRTGKITGLERRSGTLCAGPLNTDCDPVHGIAGEPWKPGCVAVAIGLVHFSPRGRIVEVCGDRIERLYYKPYEEDAAPMGNGDDEPFETVAFFGLVGNKSNLWAAGTDGIYRLGPDGVQQLPLPDFETIEDIGVSFEMPQLVIVLTDVNARNSIISGSVPILVAR